ncbi:MAG: DeoR/GlpR transcriptional regulator [Chloroflexi bacterium]|nr:DeoR/GlpR transcriptional regulator [Chloroflexota bacterium]MBV9133831.1 DeoR/GlpR transcriptional regulator [Chloroflexota bacterium]MBV9896550.1 DeoR/GlpR transcriptional regulator [Chloroflexota bacterium]
MPRKATVPSTSRQRRILGLVHERGDARVSELRDLFGVSEVTVRSDLAALASQGLLIRTHGGAALPERGVKSLELTFAAREARNVQLKARIGLAAADLVQSGQSVVLDASTTALQIARALRGRPSLHDVTVITNGVHTALELLEVPGLSTILTGGQLRATAVSLTGGLAADLLSKVHGSLGFFGAQGVTTTQGLTDVNLQEVEMKAAMASVCERVVAVVDHTKLGQVGLATFVPLSALSMLITDVAADRRFVAELESAGVEVQLV